MKNQQVTEVLDRKMDMQNVVEEYRIMLQDFFGWLDTLLKRAEGADKGRGMAISSRVALLEQLTAETSQGRPKLAAMTTKVHLKRLFIRPESITIFFQPG